jgi:translation initiation factor IF-2
MSETKTIRLASAAKELNVGIATIVEHLQKNGFSDIDNKPNTKLTEEQYNVLLKDFSQSIAIKEKAEQLNIGKRKEEEVEVEEKITEIKKVEEVVRQKVEVETLKVLGKIDLDKGKPKKEESKEPSKKATKKKTEETETPKVETIEVEPEQIVETIIETVEIKKEIPEETLIKAEAEKLTGPKILGKISLKDEKSPEQIYRKEEKQRKEEEKKKEDAKQEEKKKRARIHANKVDVKTFEKTNPGKTDGFRKDNRRGNFGAKPTKEPNETVSEKDINEKIRATMAKLAGTKNKQSGVKYRREKRVEHARRAEEDVVDGNILQVTEFITVSELANLMDVSPTQIISSCMGLGVFVSINQRIDAEIIELVASEFGYEVQFTSLEEVEEEDQEEKDAEEDLLPRPPIVTIMGHVDHGKTSLLDYVREANVVAGEMGGITQHIGAYEVTTAKGDKVTFLDTPGHEAFTAMRARGAKLTDIAIIVVAADDNVMPQTREAISHAQAAEVPMIFAINKIDKPGANPDNVRKQLSELNILVEEWGGKYQSQEISAKQGTNIDLLLEKILLEAELLELKANPNKNAVGSVIEASLDKGRGYVSTIMIQEGTMKIGDVMVAGQYYGRVKAMYNERGQRINEAGPSSPVQVLGLMGAPNSGDKLKVYDEESEAKEIANKRATILREQGLRAKKHITLDEIGRRLALGNFKELNLIIKGDVDGSVEALGDSLLKLSTEEIKINIIHKGVGQISESDVLLASASDAIIVAFQVRPSANAKAIAEKEDIQIKHYSIIYDAIEEIKAAMEGLLEPKYEEKIVGNVEIREVFKVSKVGTIAGCYVTDGKIIRANKVRIIRDGIVVYEGELDSLKRFKDDVKEVTKGYECGIKMKNYNDIREGDMLESFEQVEVKRKLN